MACSLAGAAWPFGEKERRDASPVLRVVHFTDAHLKAEGDVPQRFARCLDKIRTVEKPDVVFQGGDIIWDGTVTDQAGALAQYELADRLIRRHLGMPVTHCVGNHDVWGWKRNDLDKIGADPLFGKGMWLKWTGYASPYFSFDCANWHFIVLDSIQSSPTPCGYVAHLDDAQWRWLQQDLAGTPPLTPVCIVSHAPFLHAGVQFLDPQHHRSAWSISGSLLHLDARPFKDLLARHANVRLCLSGHIHMFSRIHYNGAAHIGNGAVSGAWWRGDMQETRPGYGVVDLYADGRVRSRFETY